MSEAVSNKVKDTTKVHGDFSAFFTEDSLEPFETDYQNRFLKVFITDKEGFAERIMDIVQIEYFDSYQKILLNYEVEFFNKYREIARFPALKDYVGMKEKGLNRENLLGLIEKIEELEVENVKQVREKSYTFFKERSLKNCLFELIVDWKKHNFDTMKPKLENALKAGEPKDTGHDYFDDIEKRLEKDFRDPITAMPVLDGFIGGGLAGGELGIVLAPPGGGKSMMLVRFACSALLAGKKVVYYTLELSEKVVGNRFDACLNQLPMKDIWEFPDVIRENAQKIRALGGGLKIEEFPTGQASINSLLSHLRTLEINENFIPDIIFIDYADIMKPLANYSEKRHSLTSIYEGIRGIAVELGVPIWTASQTNRGGLNKAEFGLDVIGEALGKAATADVVVGVGRGEEERTLNDPRAKIGILKNRNGADGFYKSAIFDTSKIFIEILPDEPSMLVQGGRPSTNKKTGNSKVDDNEVINVILTGDGK